MPQTKALEEHTLNELRDIATEEGIEGAEVFDKKAPLIQTITTMRKAFHPEADPAVPVGGLAVDESAKAPEAPADAPSVDDFQGDDPDANESVEEEVVEEAAPDAPAVNQVSAVPQTYPEPAAPVAPAPQMPAAPVEANPAPLASAPDAPAETPQPGEVAQQRAENADIKSRLDAQDKVNILIPLEPGEKRGTYHPVIFNGYRIDILKGVYVSVPQTIADIVKDSFDQMAEVGKDFELDRLDPETGRPVASSMGLRG